MAAAKVRKQSSTKLPLTFQRIMDAFPEIIAAHAQMARAVDDLGPLDDRACALVKIGICVGAGLESALRSHVRRARQMGVPREEIVQAIMLGMTTLGFPRTVAAWKWADDILADESAKRPRRRPK
jgi:4-carboxymuconolactone decarboxylase